MPVFDIVSKVMRALSAYLLSHQKIFCNMFCSVFMYDCMIRSTNVIVEN